MKQDSYCKMKHLFTLLLFIYSLGMFSQDVNKKAPDDLRNVKGLSVEVVVPKNYTATKVTLSQGATAQMKEDFIKTHNADFYYVYTNPQGKNVTKDELEEALRKQNESTITPSTLSTNPKK
jgi:hypothetical protein